MDANDFRDLALGFDDAEESAHMGAADFRVGGRIFATLAHEHLGFGNLMLSPELQQLLIAEAPEVFLPVAGGWGRMGATHIRLAEATPEQLLKGLQLAWNLRVQKNDKSRTAQGKRDAALNASFPRAPVLARAGVVPAAEGAAHDRPGTR